MGRAIRTSRGNVHGDPAAERAAGLGAAGDAGGERPARRVTLTAQGRGGAHDPVAGTYPAGPGEDKAPAGVAEKLRVALEDEAQHAPGDTARDGCLTTPVLVLAVV